MTIPSFHKLHNFCRAVVVSCVLLAFTGTLNTHAESPSTPIPDSPRIPPEISGPAPEATPTLREGSDTALLRGEIAALRADLKQLRESLNLILNQITADLRQENELLRRENQQLRQQLENQGITPDTPPPSSDNMAGSATTGRLPTAFPEPGPADASTPGPAESGLDTASSPPSDESASTEEDAFATPPPWETVASWGREPEDAKALGPDILSQKGVVGVTAPGAGRNALIALGQAIRREYDRYDIISVDIFDDRAEAEAYAQNRHPDPQHRVLTVARHVRTGQDIILVYHDGLAEEIPPTP